MTAFETLCDQSNRAAWLVERRRGIGSSDAPAILGLSPFASPLSVYTEKLGLSADREQSDAMRWGSILEPVIAREFAAETGRKYRMAGNLIRSTERPWQLATLDAEQECADREGVGVLEIKATAYRLGDWTEGVPDHVFAQVQHQLSVTGYRWASVAVLQNGCKLAWADVERDEAFIDGVLLPAEAEFWRRVEAQEPVAPDGSDASIAALRALYPADNGATVELPGHLIDLDAEREKVAAELKALVARKQEIDAVFKAAIGEASVGVLLNGVSYTHRLQTRDGYTVKPTEFRTLRRSAPKKGR